MVSLETVFSPGFLKESLQAAFLREWVQNKTRTDEVNLIALLRGPGPRADY